MRAPAAVVRIGVFLVIVAVAATAVSARDQRQAIELERMIRIGDPRAAPIIVAAMPELLVEPQATRLGGWDRAVVRGVGAFQLADLGPLLAALYHRPETTGRLKDAIREAAACFREPAAVPLQRTLMQDPDATKAQRVALAAALADAGDEEAELLLLEWFTADVRHFDRQRGWDVSWSRILPGVDSETLWLGIAALAEEDDVKIKRLLDVVIACRRIAQMDVDRLYGFIKTYREPEGNASHLWAAFIALGDVAPLDELEEIRRVTVHTDPPTVQAVREEALVRLRRRHWQQFLPLVEADPTLVSPLER